MAQALHNPPGFAAAVLKSLGIKATPAKVGFLNFWFSHEGNNSGGKNGQNNPLNVQGANPVPYNYATPAEGVAATAAVLRQSNMAVFLNQLRKPNPTNLQLATALTQTPWASSHYGATKAGNGVYVGGSLVSAFLPAGGKQPNVGTALGDIWHYIAHPGSGVQTTATAAEKAVTKPLTDTLHYILYGAAILGGVSMALVGFILIAADIGLSKKAGNSRAGDYGGRAIRTVRGGDEGAAYREGESQSRVANARQAGRQGMRPSTRREKKVAAHATKTERAKQEDNYGDVPF